MPDRTITQRVHQPTAPDPSEILDRTQFASLLGVNPRTVDRMVKRNELPPPCIGVGGRPRWLRSFVLDFLERRHRDQDQRDARLRSKLS